MKKTILAIFLAMILLVLATGVAAKNLENPCSVLTPDADSTIGQGETVVAEALNVSSCKIKVGNWYTGTLNGTAGADANKTDDYDCYYTFSDGEPAESIYDIEFSVSNGSVTKTCTASSVTVEVDKGSRARRIAATTGDLSDGISNGISRIPTLYKVIGLIGLVYLLFRKK